MAHNRSTTYAHDINAVDARPRQIRAMQLIFAGAAAVATLALFGAAQPGDTSVRLADQATGLPASAAATLGSHSPQTATSISGNGGSVIAVNDDDNTNPSSGDIFTQNAQDQSTA